MSTPAIMRVGMLGAIAVQAVVTFALLTILCEPQPAPSSSTPASVGKCIQGHRVLWHETRAQAADACLAELDRVGERRFSQTWHNFETEAGLW